MKNIIVPTDFSVKSYNAHLLGVKIAKKTKGTIHLIHVIEPISSMYSSMGESLEDDFNDIYVVKLIEKVTNDISMLKDQNSDDSFDIKTHISVGDPFQKIKELAKRLDADLVITGAKGCTDAEEFFIGSLTDKVIRSMPCPVITTKEVIDEDAFKNIVYATDLVEEHVPLMNLLMRLQDLFDSQIHIVKINTRKKFKNDIETKIELEKLADKYRLKDYTLSIYNHEDEEYGIVYFADEKQADLIAIGVHEKSGFRRLINGGSLIDEVSNHTFRPILTYHFDYK
jgi:nucleotide-binding universal stress UspA family protein